MTLLLRVAAAIALALSTVTLFRFFPRVGLPTTVFASIVALVVYFCVVSDFERGLAERRSEFRDAQYPWLKRLIFGGVSFLGLCCAFLTVIAALSIGRFLSAADLGGLSPLSFFAYHVGAPLLAPFTYFWLATKVRMARTLDIQKRNMAIMSDALRNIHFHETITRALETTWQKPNREDTKRFQDVLEAVCDAALKAVCVAGQNTESETVGSTAILFLADKNRKQFVPAAVAGGTPKYRAALLSEFRPPFWSIETFASEYNRYVGLSKVKGVSKAGLLSEFRKDTAGLVSVTGVVYEAEKQLVFEAGHDSHPLIFRDEIFDKLRADERPHFRELVGIPIVLHKRKLGVLLLLGNSGQFFYPHDAIYGIAGDMVGATLSLGILLGYGHTHGIAQLYSGAQHPHTKNEIERIERILNSIDEKFSSLC